MVVRNKTLIFASNLNDMVRATLRAIYFETFTDYGFAGIVIGFIAWLCTILVLGLVSWGAFTLIDKTFTYEDSGVGIVQDKYIVQAHTTYMHQKVGAVSVMTPIYHPKTWNLVIKVGKENLSDEILISEVGYMDIKKGDKVNCEYQLGRISNNLYINSVNW